MYCMGGWTDLEKALNSGNIEGEYELWFSRYFDSNQEAADFMNKVTAIRGDNAAGRELDSSSDTDSSSDFDASSDSNSSSEVAELPASYKAEIDQFIKDAKSGNIDKMLSALEWLNSAQAKIKPAVRSLDKNAILKAVALDKADHEAGDKYDAYSLQGALNNMQDKMSSSQHSRYNSCCGKVVIYFTMSESDLSSEYNKIYRSLR